MTKQFRLGIDTGGTYTDAALVNECGEVLAAGKRLTTHGDLSKGIHAAIGSLPADHFSNIRMVALSTTLSTNSVVEGKGGSVGVLLPGYTAIQVRKSGLHDMLDSSFIHVLEGGHSATGEELAKIEVDKATRIINSQASKVSAFAVSSVFATRNTAHEIQLRELIRQLTNKPVACGHELAYTLGAPRRALTTALNARMLLPIQLLIAAVETSLHDAGINAPIMVVNGDGSLVNTDRALKHPISTVLSGPAASVSGAFELSQCENAIVVDIGGTTTDIAIAHAGKVLCSTDGARVGNWKPLVEAVKVCSVGLGGDSEVRFNGTLCIDQRRVLPMSLLVEQHPKIMQKLERQWKGFANARQNKFAVALGASLGDIPLTRREQTVWHALLEGPMEIDALAESQPDWGRTIARLERKGLAIYSGFTPSDAAHVLGLSSHWNNKAAELAARIWARQMRYLYGCGQWEIGDAIAPSRQVVELVVAKIAHQVINVCLDQQLTVSDKQMESLSHALTQLIQVDATMDRSNDDTALNNTVLRLNFDTRLSIVGVGGSAPDYMPEVARKLGIPLQIPPNASTANAVGSVFGEVMQIVRIHVTQPSNGVFMVFHRDRPLRFDALRPALEKARSVAIDTARDAAQLAGGADISVSIETGSDHVKHDIDGELFVNSTVTATAIGKPACMV